MTDEAQNVIVLKDAYDRRSESKGDSADHWTEIFVDNIKFGSLAQGSYGTAYLTAYQTRDQLAQYFAGLKRDWEMSNTWRSIMSPRATAWSCSDVVPGATGTPARSLRRRRRILGALPTATPSSSMSITTPRSCATRWSDSRLRGFSPGRVPIKHTSVFHDRRMSMRVFLAGASGAIGRRLTPLLLKAGHEVTGMTRSAGTARELEAAGIRPAIVDVFDAQALQRAVVAVRPDVVMHQLTDLPRVLDDEAQLAAAYPRNARIRTEGTRNLVAAALAASARRFIVQSVAFAYAPGQEPYVETDPLNLVDGPRLVTVRAAADMEEQVLKSSMEAIVLRYGLLYGPGTWSEGPSRKPPLHVDAAAQAALLALTRGNGIYNIADDDGTVAIEKAGNELGFDPAFRL
jgi:nucleoside-diphosphate-sugar epimerase